MKFDMGSATLSTLATQTGGSHDELGALVRQLVAAAEPLEGAFNGAGRRAFDAFKLRTDEISADLNISLGRILTGQRGMDTAFVTGDMESADNATAAAGAANFDGARFSATR